MRAVVTGAGGFIGSAIAARLLSEGHDVVGIDSLTDYYATQLKLSNLSRLQHSSFEFRNADINHIDLEELLRGVDTVFHQAGQPGVRGSWGLNFSEYLERNVQATQKLLEAAAAASSIQRFVYASSSSIYGDAQRYPTKETDTPAPISPYGVSKLAAEHLVSLYGTVYGLPTTSLRYFTVYGPRQRPDMAFTRFLRAAAEGNEIVLFGSGDQVRDFTYVDDIVEANLLAARVEHPNGSVFNVAGGSSVTMNQVVDAIGEISGKALSVRRIRKTAGDVFRTGGSTESIHTTLGWSANTKLDVGLQTQFEWVQAALGDGLTIPTAWD